MSGTIRPPGMRHGTEPMPQPQPPQSQAVPSRSQVQPHSQTYAPHSQSAPQSLGRLEAGAYPAPTPLMPAVRPLHPDDPTMLGQADPSRPNPLERPDPLRAAADSLVDLPLVCATCGSRYPAEFKVCPRDATELRPANARPQSETDEEEDLVGQTLMGTYAITRVLGEGGMGKVYEGKHLRIGGKRFAIKVLHPELARHVEVQRRFQREAEAASSIESTNVVRVFDVLRTDEGRLFMVSEFLEGQELREHINDQGRMTAPSAVRIAMQICDGLAHAHAKGIIHRDMKPENVFLVGDRDKPEAKIIDFGISKNGDQPGSVLTKTGAIMGTPSFMAPEQARGEKVSHLADVYAVGAILYTMLTGRKPFEGSDARATLLQLLVEEPVRPRSLDPSIPEALEALVQRAMAKEPSERFTSVEALKAALEPFAVGGAAHEKAQALAPVSVEVSAAELQQARTRLVLPGIGALIFLGGAVALAQVGLLGYKSKSPLSNGQVIAIPVVTVFTLAFAVGFATWYLRSRASKEAQRARGFALGLRAWAQTGLVTLGFAFVVVRFVETVILRRAVGEAWPVWEILVPGLAILGGTLSAVFSRITDRAT